MTGVQTCALPIYLLAGRAGDAESALKPLVASWSDIHPGSAWHGEALLWLSRAQSRQGKKGVASAARTAALQMLHETELPALLALTER